MDPKRLSEHSNLFVIFYTDDTPEADGSFNIGVAYTTDRTIAQELKTYLTDIGLPNAVREFALYETHNGRQRFDIETFVNWARQIDTDWAQLLGESLMSLDQTTQKFIAESRNSKITNRPH
ncbi:hypothetical protein J4E81_005551 [Alternaria sp. BMP 2799]|nr:hypothetical protein J4E81_005551 [Alternaria sp. BMP 2799]